MDSFKALLKVASAPNYEHQLNKTLNLFGGLWMHLEIQKNIFIVIFYLEVFL